MNKPTDDKPPSILTRIFSFITGLIAKLIPDRRAESKQDILDNLKQAEVDGIVAHDAYDMMQRVLLVSDLQVRDVMVPRSSMVQVHRDDNLDKCLDILVESGHSRVPVWDDERDQFIGILLAKDLLRFFDEEELERFNLRDLLRPVVFVPESKRLNVLLSEFRSNRNHIAIVVDEYASIAGMVTIEDVLEQIVGDIEDEHDYDDGESLIRTLDNGEVVVKAILPLDEFNEAFQTYFVEDSIDTIGGLISQQCGHVPQRGEKIEMENLTFEIVHADSRRVHLIRIIR